MNFLQFFVWGSYLTSFGTYMYQTLNFEGTQIGVIFVTLGIASVFMPTIMGIIADRWVNAERVYAFCHILGGVFLIYMSMTKNPDNMFWIMLLVSMMYMPTIALNNSISYILLKNKFYDVQKTFPKIRVWGTVGFVMAMWFVDFNHWTKSPIQLIVAASAAILLGVYALTLPQCKPAKETKSKGRLSTLGLDAFVLFKRKKIAIFFIFAMLLGAALQVTNQWGVAFVDHFKDIDLYENTFGVKYPNILVSISQISETLFILTIPFFLKKFGIKKVMIISMFAWVLRFGLFALGDPGSGLPLLILSMIVYGMAFDFFNISGSLFIEKESDSSIRSSAQGLFMLMTNGLGAMIGSYGSGWVVEHYSSNGVADWTMIWTVFAIYAACLAVIFPFVFKYKHNPQEIQEINH